MEPHLVLLIINRDILTFDMIFFMQQLNPGLEKWKMIYHFCDVLINKITLKGQSIILEFNYFFIDGISIHQIKGTLLGTKFAVIGSTLIVAHEESKMFASLPKLCPYDFFEFFM